MADDLKATSCLCVCVHMFEYCIVGGIVVLVVLVLAVVGSVVVLFQGLWQRFTSVMTITAMTTMTATMYK